MSAFNLEEEHVPEQAVQVDEETEEHGAEEALTRADSEPVDIPVTPRTAVEDSVVQDEETGVSSGGDPHNDHVHDHSHDHTQFSNECPENTHPLVSPADVIELHSEMEEVFIVGTADSFQKVTKIAGLESLGNLKVWAGRRRSTEWCCGVPCPFCWSPTLAGACFVCIFPPHSFVVEDLYPC
ncbi:unnamed protein product [Discosporangium mesarthrocarpum]